MNGDEMMEWLSVAKVSEQVGIPPETVRRYINRHSGHLQVKKGHKSYQIAESSVSVFVQIRTLYGEGKQADEVDKELDRSGRPTIISVNAMNESVNVDVAIALAALDSKLNAIASMLMNVDERLKESEQYRESVNQDMNNIREQFIIVNQEVAVTTEKLSDRIADIQNSLSDEIRKGQKETSEQLEQISSRVETYSKPRRGFWSWGKR